MNYEILEWDSQFFGFTVACLQITSIKEIELKKLIKELTKKKIELLYIFCNSRLDDSIAECLGGRLVDIKVTYVNNLQDSKLNISNFESFAIPFNESMSYDCLEKLAISSGEYSRFATDPNFPRSKFVAMYKTWIRRSVLGEIAKEVLVIHENEDIAGMVTLGEKNGRGDIGLVAVDQRYRGRKIGNRLIMDSLRYFSAENYSFAQVVTQKDNLPACRLYEKCGFSFECEEYLYHFWL